MSLTVLSVAFPFAPVGPDAVGGAEQIVAALDEGITQAGYRSLVVACEGSKTHGKLFATPPVLELCDELATRRAHARHRETIERALAEERVDVVHFHGHDFHRYLPRAQAPMVATLHLTPSAYPEEILRRPPDRMRLVCVSASQRARMPEGAARVELINNGVALDRLRPGLGKRAFVIALGRICPEKGFHLALDAAAQAKAPMLLGGEVFGYDAHRRYFEDAIAPRLDARRRFLGPVSAPRKRRLLAAARCLLLPSLCEETSSLVAMEALACGTPVIAFAAGALAEIVEHGETGFLVKSVDEMAARIADIDSIDPAVCRRRAEERFSSAQMVKHYLALYEGLARPATRAAGGGAVEVEEVRSLEGLERIHEAWRDLWSRCPSATPFQSPSWLIAHARHFGADNLFTLALWRGAALVGLAPLRLGARRVTLLGGGVSDYLDILIDPAHEAKATEALMGHLAARAALWDECDFAELRPDAALLRAASPHGWVDLCAPETACPVLRLSREADRANRAILPGGQRHKLEQARRRAERDLGARFAAAREGEMGNFLDALVRLHGLRWSTRGETGVLADAAVQRFHHEAAKGLGTAGALRLYALFAGERVVAVLYGFEAGGRFHYYLSGFDPDFERYSVGTLIVGHAIDEAARAGAREFDFLRGREPYKYRWGAEDRWSRRRRLFHDPARATSRLVG